MQRTARWIPTATATGELLRWGAWLRRVGQRLVLDDEQRFLCEARDLADLESRLRRLERGRADRFGSLPAGL